MMPPRWDSKLYAHATCCASMACILWLANPLLSESFRIVSGPAAVAISAGGLASIAVVGIAWPVSLRYYPPAELQRLARELARGALLGLLAHGADSLTRSMLMYGRLLWPQGGG